MTIPVKALTVDTRPSGHTHVTFRAPDGRRLSFVFAPGQFTEQGMAIAIQYIQSKRRVEAPYDRNV